LNLAHGVAGGSNLEALVVAVPLVGLGLVFFFQKTASPMVSLIMVVVGLAMGVAAFTVLKHEQAPTAASSGRDDAYRAAYLALCDARAAGAPARARRIFFDRVHTPLHELAAEVGASDRDVAADLLEAKNEVEAAFDDAHLPTSLSDGLDALSLASADALRSLALEVPRCA
jgi:hypothetical protein